MRNLPIGIIQQHNTNDIHDNMLRLEQNIRRLARQGARLIVLQELHNALYFCQREDVKLFEWAEPIPGPSTDFYGRVAREEQVVIVTSLFEKRAPGLYHNTAVVIECDGTIAGKYRKMHIPDDPAYYEKFYFTPGDLGFKPIDTSVGRLGVLVCWDQWYPEAARLMALQGAEILIYPTAIGLEPTDPADEQERQRQAWITVQRGHAVANGLPVVTVNRVGYETLPPVTADGSPVTAPLAGSSSPTSPDKAFSGISFWGSSFVAGSQGELLFMAEKDQEQSALVTVDLDHCEQVRRWWPFLRDRRIDEYGQIVRRFVD